MVMPAVHRSSWQPRVQCHRLRHRITFCARHISAPARRPGQSAVTEERESAPRIPEQVTGTERDRYVDWSLTLPLWVDLGKYPGGARVLACAVDRPSRPGAGRRAVKHRRATGARARPRATRCTPRSRPAQGTEISLTDHGHEPYRDSDLAPPGTVPGCSGGAPGRRHCGDRRDGRHIHHRRRRSVPAPAAHRGEPEHRTHVQRAGSVFYGHYWRTPEPQHRTINHYTACVDFQRGQGRRIDGLPVGERAFGLITMCRLPRRRAEDPATRPPEPPANPDIPVGVPPNTGAKD